METEVQSKRLLECTIPEALARFVAWWKRPKPKPSSRLEQLDKAIAILDEHIGKTKERWAEPSKPSTYKFNTKISREFLDRFDLCIHHMHYYPIETHCKFCRPLSPSVEEYIRKVEEPYRAIIDNRTVSITA